MLCYAGCDIKCNSSHVIDIHVVYIAGQRNERPVSQLEKELAYHQGKHTATITIALKVGRDATAK